MKDASLHFNIVERLTYIVQRVDRFCVVALVRLLMPDGTDGSTGSPSIASLVYDEGSSDHQNDSNARKYVLVCRHSLCKVTNIKSF